MSTDRIKKSPLADSMSKAGAKQSQKEKDKVPTAACSFHLPRDLFDRAKDWAAYNGMSFTGYVTELLIRDLKTKAAPPRRKKAITQADLKFIHSDKSGARK